VLLTPDGRGAVASLLVEGPLAGETVGALLHLRSGQTLGEQPWGKIALGRWQSAETGEELVVCRRDAQRVEIHCHGGHAAATAIIATLVDQGCEVLPWRQWVRMSTADPIAAAARIELAAAPTQRTAGILWDQYTGALRRALDEVAMHIAAGDARSALKRIDALVEWSALGRHLVTPWTVVLAGRPNVGKSSLINALLGYERAIVHHIPGTTRDIVAGAAAIEGWPIELADTAGLHASTEAVEAAGIRLARKRLSTADLVVLVFDASRAPSDDDLALAKDWPQALQVWNKCDLVGRDADTTRAGGLLEPIREPSQRRGQSHFAPKAPQNWDGPQRFSDRLLISAKTREGIEGLARAIARRLVPRAPAAGQAVPFAPQQIAALRQIHAALSANQLATGGQLLADSRNWATPSRPTISLI
jgi:tRNA modification GTPase